MAVSSVLNPEAIIGNQKGSSAGFQNFLTGGSPLGSSVVETAANNIVGFQRSSVKPQYPDINNIINSITNNVNDSISNLTEITNRTIDSKVNNVKNELYSEIQNNKSSDVTQLQTVVQNIQNQVNQTLQQSLNNFSKDYQDRIKQVDDAKPTGILGKFLSVYRTAIDFINFFGNQKNINRLRDNLDILKKSFTESFEVAKLVRNVIIKIVKQLSSLPKASPSGGGGLNIDVDVPGGGLKRTAPRGLGNMFRGKGKMLALGAGALGLGAGGAAAVNALSDSGETQPSLMPIDISGDAIYRLQEIIQRFSFAVDSLISGARASKNTSGGSGGKSSSSTAPKSKETPSPENPSPSGPADFTGSENAEKAFNYFISQGYSKEQAAGIVGNLMQENRALNPTVANSIGHKGIAQWDPKDRYPKMVAFAKSKGLDPNTLEAQLQFVEHEMVTGSGGLSKKRFTSEAKTVERAAVLMREGFFRPGESEAMDSNRIQFGQQVLSKYGNSAKPTKPINAIQAESLKSNKESSVSGTPVQASSVATSLSQQQIKEQVAQQVSQPPPSQQQGQVNFMPIDLSGGQQQQQSSGGTGAVSSPPPSQKSGPTVPILPSNNPDNFLVLYSRMVYNVVDG
jgi:hypothetical protein